MKRLVPVLALLLPVLPASAHHSFAPYDSTKTVMLDGTIKAFQWGNPHVELEVMVRPGAGGESQEWRIITSGPNILTRFGWTRASVKPGDRVSVLCNPLSDGSHGGRLHTMRKLDTGETLQTKLSGLVVPDDR